MRRSPLPAIVIAAMAAALLVSGSGLARPAQDVPLTLESATFSGEWKESFLVGGRVAFSGTVGGPADLAASLRRAEPPRSVLSRTSASVAAAGGYTGSLHVTARPQPGTYVVTVTGTSGGAALAPAELQVTIPAPPEGIVDRASASTTRNGPPTRRTRGPRKELWARFHFTTLPQASTVKIVWRTPSFTFVGAATKPATETVVSFVRSTAPLQRGVWYAFIEANGEIAKRVAIRIT